jgi:tRNA threonylcarbamoyladenosine biosynthesis protein TsaB
MITLAIDASTYTGDVAVLDGSSVLAEESTAMKDAARERLMPAVAAALERAKVDVGAVDRVVCGGGPGSFTSLRIAGGIAKGIATGLSGGRPLFAVPSLALVVAGSDLPVGRYLVALDALRGEFYVGLYDVTLDEVAEVEPARLVPASIVTDGERGIAVEYEARLVSPSHLPDALAGRPRARGVVRLERLLEQRGPVDIGAWEPAYGRLAEAQVRWESAHGRPLPAR